MSSRKTALVTGAAARIGAAICTSLHNRGCDVLIHYNSSGDAAQKLADRLNQRRGQSAFTVQADLSQPAGIDTLPNWSETNFASVSIPAGCDRSACTVKALWPRRWFSRSASF